jgi:hypothetical protein
LFIAMKLNNLFNLIIVITSVYFLFSVPGIFYGQAPENSDPDNPEIKIVEQALKNYDKKKQNKEEEFKAQLNSQLAQATKAWIANMEKIRYNQLDNIIEQDWDKQPRSAMIMPFNNEYYLRGYKYNTIDSNIVKTESLNPEYKGIVTIKEGLYAEISHHSNVSDLKPYLYTVINTCALSFVYKNDDFELINTDRKMESKVNEMSSEARKEWLWRSL